MSTGNSLQQENVTIRRPAKCNSENDLTKLEIDMTSSSTMLFENTMDSLPNLSTIENPIVVELKINNNNLALKLQSAHKEIENLITENFKLKRELENCQMVIKTLKQLNSTQNNEARSTNSTPRRKGTKQNKLKPLQDILSPLLNNIKSTNQDSTDDSSILTVTGDILTKDSKTDTATDTYTYSDSNMHKKENSNMRITKRNNSFSNKSEIALNVQPQDVVNKVIDKDNISSNITNKRSILVDRISAKKKIIIIADQYGKNVRHSLEKLLGPEYQVYCFIKPGAESSEVLNVWKQEISSLTLNDCVVVLTGSNDRNPFKLKCNLMSWVTSCQNTNVIISEVPHNNYLNLFKLNYELKFLCSNFKRAVFLDMDYCKSVPRRKLFALNLSRSLLKEILSISYRQNYLNYIKNAACVTGNSKLYSKCDKSCQTEFCNVAMEGSASNETDDSSEFFRGPK
ncbi:unnamed protein product [Parnassius apollo]|uniref:(apollo) hypothetical protein n=1 Tax=Parnassius apollo TaxID=110799 RepID=A0A8S3WZU2_PARAO|nr:unnamed protein product [Parnassius apollo]